MRNYQIPTSISTELKIAKWMYLTDLFLLIGLLLFRQSTVSLVSDRLVIPYTIFIACVGLFLIIVCLSIPNAVASFAFDCLF